MQGRGYLLLLFTSGYAFLGQPNTICLNLNHNGINGHGRGKRWFGRNQADFASRR
ncbi:MAG: hypothetical protein ACI9G1_003097 [Pirellulaceae bacterium]|jgi:hypothetical protein